MFLLLNLLYKPTKKIITIVANKCSNIFSYDSLPFPVPELGIINSKLHTAASKQTESYTSTCNIHFSCRTQFATKFSVTRPESNSAKSLIATSQQHTAETEKVYSCSLLLLLLTTTGDTILS